MFIPVRFARAVVVPVMAAFLLSGCQYLGEKFQHESEKPLPGDRISILQLQHDLTPSTGAETVTLSDAWENKFWPQAGGYPTHAMGHLALGADIKRAWRSSVGEGGDRRTPLMTQPVIAENTVFSIDAEGRVSAFDLEKGKRKWRVSFVPRREGASGRIGGGIAWAAGKLYATAGYQYLAALDPQTGKQIWRVEMAAPVRSAPTVMDGRLYVVTLDNRLFAYNAEDGTALWNYAGVSEGASLLGSASVAVDETIVVLPLSSGEIYGLRPENGQVVWQDNLSAVRRGGTLSSIADVRGLPVIDRGLVFAVSYSGRLVAIDVVTGQRVWQREIGSAETPWVSGDTVFVVTNEQQLLALSREAGEIRWIRDLPRWADKNRVRPIIWAGPVLAGGRLFLTSTSMDMVEIDPANGKTLKVHPMKGQVMVPPVVSGKTLVVQTRGGEISAWR